MFSKQSNTNNNKVNKKTTKQLDLTESNVSVKSNAVSMNQPVSLLDESAAFKGISFTNLSKNDDNAYRGSTIVGFNNSLPGLDMPIGFNAMPISLQSIKKTTNIGLNKKNNEPKLIEPKIIAKSEIDFIPSKCKINDDKPETTPEYVNMFTSIVVNNADIDNVVNFVDETLNEFSNEIEYNLNKTQYIINGIVFIMNIAVNFAVEFFIENDNDVRVEFRRIEGDTFAFEQLFNDIKNKIDTKFNKSKNNDFPDMLPGLGGLLSLDYSMSMTSFEDEDSKESLEFEYTEKELNQLTSDILNDTYCIESLDELAASCKNSSKVSTSITSNSKLYNAIIAKLTHQDITCVRSALLLLNLLITKDTNANILPTLFNIINTHTSNLIKSYTIQLLNTLTMISWTKYVTPKIVKSLNINLKKCEKTLKISSKFLTKAMFNNIYAKLV